jgi:hypothetical protein
VGERIEQWTARLGVRNLAEPGRRLASDVDDRILDQLDEGVGVLGRGVARNDVGDELPHRLAFITGHAGERVERDQLGDLFGVEGRAAAEALHLGEVSASVELHRFFEHARIVQRDERPRNLRAVRIVGLEQGFLQRIFSGVAVRRSEVGQNLRSHTADAVVDLGERVDGERNGRFVTFPPQLNQRFLLQLVLLGLRCELAPFRHAVGFGQNVDVLFDRRDLVERHLGALGLQGEDGEKAACDGDQDEGENHLRVETPSLEVGIVGTDRVAHGTSDAPLGAGGCRILGARMARRAATIALFVSPPASRETTAKCLEIDPLPSIEKNPGRAD